MNDAAQPRANPYVGPRAFHRGETLYGRQREVMELLDLLIAERIVLLHSPSGAGKTSLIHAALIPELEKEGFHTVDISRRKQPLAMLKCPPRLRFRLCVVMNCDSLIGRRRETLHQTDVWI